MIYSNKKGWENLGSISQMKKFKYYLTFKGGHDLVFETDTDLRKAKKDKINGGTFVVTENQYTINISQLKSIKVKIQK